MRWVALPLGIVVLIVTFGDAFTTLVMPRAARRRVRLTRLLFTVTWRPVRWYAVRRRTTPRREHALAAAAPAFLFVLLAVWAGLVVIGYALILWSAPFAAGIGGVGDDSFTSALYLSGTSLFTIGFGDVVATGWTRVVTVVEGANGLALVAVVIAYLPVLYAAFNRREVGVLLLDARAGTPPSGPELLRTICKGGDHEDLPALFAEWERWTADVLESHLSYPLLVFFRSPHDNTSWVTSLGAVLDAATLVLASVAEKHQSAAEMLYTTGVHAVEDLWRYFGQPERDGSIGRDEFDQVYARLAAGGFLMQEPDGAWSRFVELRSVYGGRLDALAVMLAAPPGQWIGDRSQLVPGARH